MKVILCPLLFSVVSLSLIALNEAFPPFYGNCVPEVQCPPNEVYFKCGNNCQTECSTLNETCTKVYIMCPSGCYCKEGFAREPRTSRCIPIEQCPNLANNSTESAETSDCDESDETTELPDNKNNTAISGEIKDEPNMNNKASAIKNNPHEWWYYIIYS